VAAAPIAEVLDLATKKGNLNEMAMHSEKEQAEPAGALPAMGE
jgi:hypothetical protein